MVPIVNMPFSKPEAESYLKSLLNKTLRITTTDTRMFLGEFKCTDSDRNVILSRTYEYRLPAPPTPLSTSPAQIAGGDKILLDMTSRYLGLVVVPGQYITKIEVEEFVSQMKERRARLDALGEKSQEGVR